jgi:hypothetical protein
MTEAASRNLSGLTIRWISRVLAAAVGLLLSVLATEVQPWRGRLWALTTPTTATINPLC